MDVDKRTLIEPAAVVIHAVEKAKEIFNFQHDSYVLVQGFGPIGLFLLAVVRTMGVRNIIAVDGDAQRLYMARQLGAAYNVYTGWYLMHLYLKQLIIHILKPVNVSMVPCTLAHLLSVPVIITAIVVLIYFFMDVEKVNEKLRANA